MNIIFIHCIIINIKQCAQMLINKKKNYLVFYLLCMSMAVIVRLNLKKTFYFHCTNIILTIFSIILI